MHTTRRLATLAGAAVIALGLGACTITTPTVKVTETPEVEVTETTPPGTPLTVKAGDCLADQVENANGTFDADLDSVVPCTEKNIFLVYGVLDLDEMFLPDEDASEDEILAARDSITVNTEDGYAPFRAWADIMCGAEALFATGLYDVGVPGGTAIDVNARPAGNFFYDITVSSPDNWLAGDAKAICSLAWQAPNGTRADLNTDYTLDLSNLTTQDWSPGLRRCVIWVGDGTDNYNDHCSEPHWMEATVSLDPWLLLGDDARHAFDRSSDADVVALDPFCDAFVSRFVGDGADASAYRGVVTWFTWDESGVMEDITCGFSVADSQSYDVVGSLVGIGAGTPETVYIGG